MQAILPIAGVPDELIRVLNDRLRNIEATVAAAQTSSSASSSRSSPTTPRVPDPPSVLIPQGAATLTHVGRVIKVTATSTIGETSFLDSEVVHAVKSTQAGLAALAATLGSGDAGKLVYVTDYAHTLEWSGTGWQWAPGESGSGMLVSFAIAPTGSGWHLCDGSVNVKYLKSDGTTGTINLPNTAATPAYIKNGPAYSATITAAGLPTFSGTTNQGTSAVSAGTPSGTVSQPTFSGGAMAGHQHAESLITFAGAAYYATNSPFGTRVIANSYTQYGSLVSGTGGPPINLNLTESVSAGTPSGTVSQPTFSGSALGTHTHTLTPAGTIALPGDPMANFPAPLYFRQ